MRDRLIELIGSKVCGDYSPSCDEWQPHSCEKCYANDCRIGELADFLLANGVIVPPCPINHGELFAVVDLYNRHKIVGHLIAKYDVDCIIIGYSQKLIYRCCNASNEWEDFDGEQIGKTVFLTREEAEAALKGGADNEQRKAD